MKRSKKYLAVAKKVDPKKFYTVDEAIKLAQETSFSKFVGSLDIIINFNIPAKAKNESIRGSVTLPNQSGPSKKVVVIAEIKDQETAKEAGADIVGDVDLIKKIEEGYTDFDVLIATPVMMVKLAKLGKVLGPKGLMPNPKNETVTTDLKRVVKSYKAGKLDFKLSAQGSIKTQVGKLDFTLDQLKDNFNAFFKSAYSETMKLGPNRLISVMVKASMGPSIRIDKGDILKEA